MRSWLLLALCFTLVGCTTPSETSQRDDQPLTRQTDQLPGTTETGTSGTSDGTDTPPPTRPIRDTATPAPIMQTSEPSVTMLPEVLPTPEPPQSSDGTMFLRNLQRNAFVPDLTIDTSATIQTLFTEADPHSTPLIVDTIAYVRSTNALHAVDLQSGEQVWSALLPSSSMLQEPTPRSSPSVAGGLVFVGADFRGLFAIDRASGLIVWQYDSYHPVLSTPIVSEGIVFITLDDTLHALEANTGRSLWERQACNGDNVAIDGNLLFVNCRDDRSTKQYSGSYLVALRTTTGQLVWRYELATMQRSQAFGSRRPEPNMPVVANGVVYVRQADAGEKGGSAIERAMLYAIDAHTGDERWTTTLQSERDYDAPVVTDDYVYVGDVGGLKALDVRTGDTIWTVPAERASFPVVGNGVVYVVRDDTAIQAVNAKTGEPLWEKTVPSGLVAPPAVFGQTLVFPTQDRTLVSIGTFQIAAKSSGAIQWSTTTFDLQQYAAGTMSFSPDGQTLFVATNGGALEAWNLARTSQMYRIRPQEDTTITAIGTTPDGSRVLVGTGVTDVFNRDPNVNFVSIWQTSDGTLIQEYKANAYLQPVAFSPDGRTWATTVPKEGIQLWNGDGTPGRLLSVPNMSPQSLPMVFSPDGQFLAVSALGDTVQIIRVADGGVEQTLEIDGTVYSMEWAPDSKLLGMVVGRTGGSNLDLYQIPSGQILPPLQNAKPTAFAISPDGAFVVTGENDGSIHLWRLSDMSHVRVLGTLEADGCVLGCIGSVNISPDGLIVAAYAMNEIRLWHLGNVEQEASDAQSLVGTWMLDNVEYESSTGGKYAPDELVLAADGSYSYTVEAASTARYGTYTVSGSGLVFAVSEFLRDGVRVPATELRDEKDRYIQYDYELEGSQLILRGYEATATYRRQP